MRKKFYTIRFLFSIASCHLASPSFSQPGFLDQTFGIGGVTITDFAGASDDGRSVVIQNDGKILVGGKAASNTINSDFGIVRYNDDGSLDNSFGSNGKVLTDFGTVSDYGCSVALQSDGKIVLAGNINSGTQTGIVRYNIDGSLDSLFGIGGKVIFAMGFEWTGQSVAIQNDDKIVIGGRSGSGGPSEFSLVRFNANGDLDSTFGTIGYVSISIGNSNCNGFAIAIQGDEKIIIAGDYWNGTDWDFALVRYNNNGSLDTSFNSSGTVSVDINSWDIAYSVTVQTNNKIIVAGTCYCSPSSMALVRYENNGILDQTFGSGGIDTIHFGNFHSGGSSVRLQSDGKIVISGNSYNVSNSDLALVRLDSNGILDASFNNTGYVITDLGGKYDYGASVAIQNDGKIIVAGRKGDTLNMDFAVARYNGDIVNIDEIKQTKFAIKISPNPTYDNFVVSFNKQIENGIFEIFDVTGKVLYTQALIKEHSVVISEKFNPGIYIICIRNKNEMWTSRFISQ